MCIRDRASTVAFLQDGGVLVGNQAKRHALKDPKNVIYDAKRFIGRKYDDPSVGEQAKKYAFAVVENTTTHDAAFRVHGRTIAPSEVGAEVVKALLKASGGTRQAPEVQVLPAYKRSQYARRGCRAARGRRAPRHPDLFRGRHPRGGRAARDVARIRRARRGRGAAVADGRGAGASGHRRAARGLRATAAAGGGPAAARALSTPRRETADSAALRRVEDRLASIEDRLQGLGNWFY